MKKMTTEAATIRILSRKPQNNSEKLVYMIARLTMEKIESGEYEWDPSGWGVTKRDSPNKN